MKLKKLLVIAATGALLLASLPACGKDEEKKDTATTEATTQSSTTEDSNKTSGAYISFNGVDLQIDQSWDEVKDKLGSETKPSEKIEPCGGGDYIQIMHFYDGLTVYTLRDEKIVSLDLPADSATATINGQLKNGDSVDTIKSVLGATPNAEDEYMISYSSGKVQVNIYITDGAMSGAGFMTNPE